MKITLASSTIFVIDFQEILEIYLLIADLKSPQKFCIKV